MDQSSNTAPASLSTFDAPHAARSDSESRPRESSTLGTYIRLIDGAEMIEVAPHQYVNRAVLVRLGYR